jgi:LPXTG-motif cell wall-anchored protein
LCAVTGGNRNLADYQSVTVDPCGRAVLVYTDDHAPVAHTVIARQTAGNNLYAKPAATCPGSASTVPVSVPVHTPSRTPSLATTGRNNAYAWAALALLVLATTGGAIAWRRREQH